MLEEEEFLTIKPAEFNEVVSKYLKNTNKLTLPENHDLIKTSHGKQYPPSDPDWYYVRATSIIRNLIVSKINKRKIGVGSLSRRYGCSKKRGARPSKHVDAAKGIIRKTLQNFEAMNWVEKGDNDRRVVTDLAIRELKTLFKNNKY